MSESYRYFAFISYSSKDVRFAEELLNFLPEFKLPTIIQEEYNLPETLTPIYRDVTDIQIAELQKILRQELERSRFLIIICSPHSAVSQWVNREAEYFIELERYSLHHCRRAGRGKEREFSGHSSSTSRILAQSAPQLGNRQRSG